MNAQATALNTANRIAVLDTDHAQAEVLLEIAIACKEREHDLMPRAVCVNLARAHCRRAAQQMVNLTPDAAADLMPSEARREHMLRLLQQQHSLETQITDLSDELPDQVREKAQKVQATAAKHQAIIAGVRRAQKQVTEAADASELAAAYVQAAAGLRRESQQLMNLLSPETQPRHIPQHAAIVEMVESLVCEWQKNLAVIKSPLLEKIDMADQFSKFSGMVTPGEALVGIAIPFSEQWSSPSPFMSFYHRGAIHHHAMQDPISRDLPIDELYREIAKFRDVLQYRKDELDHTMARHANAALRAIELDIPDLEPQQFADFMRESSERGLLPQGAGPLVMDLLCEDEPGMWQRLAPTPEQTLPRGDDETVNAIIRAAEEQKMAPLQLEQLRAFLNGSPNTPSAPPPACDEDRRRELQLLALSIGVHEQTAAALVKIAAKPAPSCNTTTS